MYIRLVSDIVTDEGLRLKRIIKFYVLTFLSPDPFYFLSLTIH